MSDLKQLRERHGLKAIELAAITGLSAEHISRCEHGSKTMSDLTLDGIRYRLTHKPMLEALRLYADDQFQCCLGVVAANEKREPCWGCDNPNADCYRIGRVKAAIAAAGGE